MNNKRLAERIRALLNDATPAPWAPLSNGQPKYFPRLRVGPELPYAAKEKEKHSSSVTFNEGLTPDDVRQGFGFGTQMATCWANVRLVATLVNNLPTILKALEKS